MEKLQQNYQAPYKMMKNSLLFTIWVVELSINYQKIKMILMT